MRPVRRGPSPINADFEKYEAALPELVSRLGQYCSYCERPILTNLAVEHIQPKGLLKYEHLEGRWENFLLGCVNCNSTKTDKDVTLGQTLLPDRDNTFAAFIYSADGKVQPGGHLSAGLQRLAKDSLALTGLDKKISRVTDSNGKLVALDRVAQRMETWATALEAKADLLNSPDNDILPRYVVKMARATGFISIWMTVFGDDTVLRQAIIDAFDGTRGSGCFDADTQPISPAPNPDRLSDGGKI